MGNRFLVGCCVAVLGHVAIGCGASNNAASTTGSSSGGGTDGGTATSGTGGTTSSSTLTLTPAGATVTLAGATITFPANAVAANQEVTAAVVEMPNVALSGGRTASSTVLSLTPHGTVLSQPATVSLLVNAGVTGNLRYMRLASDQATEWTDEGAATILNGRASFTISRFSFETTAAQLNQACVPVCGDRVCGADPECGTSCGTCAEGVCTEAGTCVTPCDSCDPGFVCTPQGTCAACTPDCDGGARECGNDGCGGTCGSGCANAEVCAAGVCTATWSGLSPCATQPTGSVHPMVGGCSERGYRTAFAPAPSAGASMELVWSFSPQEPSSTDTKYMYPPVVDDSGMVYVTRRDGLWAVLDGTLIWKVLIADQDNTYLMGPPVIVGDKVVVVAQSGVAYARYASTGLEAWSTVIAPSGAELSLQYPKLPFVHDGNVVLHADNRIWTLAGSDGTATSFYWAEDFGSHLDPSLRGNLMVSTGLTGYAMKAFNYPPTEAPGPSGPSIVWEGVAYVSRRAPVSFLPIMTAMPNTLSWTVAQGDILVLGSNGINGARYVGFVSATTGAYALTDDQPDNLYANRTKLVIPDTFAFPRFAVSSTGKILVTNGTFATASPPYSHCLADLSVVAPTCTTTFATTRGISAQPVATPDGRFVVVDLAGNLHVVSYASPSMPISFALPGVTLANDDEVAGAPAIGANGTIYVTFGAGGGKLFAVKVVPPGR